MGSSTSKVSRGAARQYPKHPTSAVSAPRVRGRPGPHNISKQASTADSNATRPDGGDPDIVTGEFSQRLQQMGIVQPNPTLSHTSSATPHSTSSSALKKARPDGRQNPTLTALDVRQRLQQEADEQAVLLGGGNTAERRFVDMRAIVDAMRMLNRGMNQNQVEKRLRMQTGALARLGGPNIVSHESSAQ
ncbi:uncharacterized protein F5Z01DRAFT_651265 [Emericellopsis atlantica]|uniref:Helix-turn-helix domain-containing protein n=1 Tax=Emericellopsis atlantica TaxID=2614577 RepID=A0A9P7ZR71_9HYPO|nr:uncharacterized protein F5Z01DRAFT_651265 [Emericellopsis atlantica]KAG9256158.1 hypothetical protein F5Z01DRAFT_651265 [Emericellopsis atlantica]